MNRLLNVQTSESGAQTLRDQSASAGDLATTRFARSGSTQVRSVPAAAGLLDWSLVQDASYQEGNAREPSTSPALILLGDALDDALHHIAYNGLVGAVMVGTHMYKHELLKVVDAASSLVYVLVAAVDNLEAWSTVGLRDSELSISETALVSLSDAVTDLASSVSVTGHAAPASLFSRAMERVKAELRQLLVGEDQHAFTEAVDLLVDPELNDAEQESWAGLVGYGAIAPAMLQALRSSRHEVALIVAAFAVWVERWKDAVPAFTLHRGPRGMCLDVKQGPDTCTWCTCYSCRYAVLGGFLRQVTSESAHGAYDWFTYGSRWLWFLCAQWPVTTVPIAMLRGSERNLRIERAEFAVDWEAYPYTYDQLERMRRSGAEGRYIVPVDMRAAATAAVGLALQRQVINVVTRSSGVCADAYNFDPKSRESPGGEVSGLGLSGTLDCTAADLGTH